MRVRRRSLALLATLGGGLLLMLSSTPALALETFTHSQFGERGTGPGQFEFGEEGTGVAVNESSGDIYVADGGSNRVETFNAKGEYLFQFNGSENPKYPTGFATPTMVAVDNSTSNSDPSVGDVYVVDSGHEAVDKFNERGEFLSMLTAPEGFGELAGVATDPSGNVWVYSRNGTINEFNDALDNGFLQEWGSGYETRPGLAVDSNDDVFVLRGTPNVEMFSADGEDKGKITTCGCATGLAVDEANDDLFVDEGGKGIVYNSAQSEIYHPFGEGYLGAGSGLAVDPAPDGKYTLYVADEEKDVVQVFSPITYADVHIGSAEALQSTPAGETATLTAVADSGGEAVTSCSFEYGTTLSYGSSTPCVGSVGSSPSALGAELTGLPPGTTFYYRLAVANAEGVAYSSDAAFTTAPAILGSASTSDVTSFAARLNGTLDPGPDLTPLYHFEYGLTSAYGASVPVPDAGASPLAGAEGVSQTLTGLQPDTTYHFALVVGNAGGGVTVGPDATFTTRPLVAPAALTGGAEGVSQTTATLTGSLDPEGLESTYRFEYGTSTSYGASWPTIEAHAGYGASTESVGVYVEDLQPGTTYHYRLVAVNEDGTTYGPDETLTTPAYPSSAIQEAPTSGRLGVALPGEGTSKPAGKKAAGKKKAGKKKAKQGGKRRRAKRTTKAKGRRKRG